MTGPPGNRHRQGCVAESEWDRKNMKLVRALHILSLTGLLVPSLAVPAAQTLSRRTLGMLPVRSTRYANGPTSFAVNPPGIYVSSLHGSDTNSGASPDAAIATLAEAYFLANNHTTNIYLQHGSVFHEPFHVPDNATVSAYGTGAKPIVDGTIVLTNAGFSRVAGESNTYAYPLSRSSLWSTNPVMGFACSNVLMIWETTADGTYRLGTRWDGNAGYGSTASVELNTGSFWYDTNDQVLYIHNLEDSDPAADGNGYAASMQTLALWGGTNFLVQDVEARYAYAYDQQGNEGYACDATGPGTYLRCKFHGGWNHVAGYAQNAGAWTTPLTWDSCDIYDGEESASASLCIVFNGGETNPPPVFIWTNCLVYQPSSEGSYTCVGFYCHGRFLDERIIACAVTNVSGYGGLQYVTAFSNNVYAYPSGPSDRGFFDFPYCPVVNCTFWNTNGDWFFYQGGLPTTTNAFVGCTFFNTPWHFTSQSPCFTNCLFVSGTTIMDLSSIDAGSSLVSVSNIFCGAAYVYNLSPTQTDEIAVSDYNDYYGNSNIAYYTNKIVTLAQWQALFPQFDSHSSSSNPDIVLTTPVIKDPAAEVNTPPSLEVVGISAADGFQFLLHSETGGVYWIQQSSDLASWAGTFSVTNLTGTLLLVQPYSSVDSQSFFRAMKLP